MKKAYPFIATALVGILIGFFAGAYARSEYERRVIAQSMYVISQSIGALKAGEPNQLIRIYKQYENSPEAGAEYLKRIIAIKYERGNSGLETLFEHAPESTVDYENNLQIEEFLKENPLKECAELPETSRASCSIENRIPRNEEGV